jgi:hypothetical protein
VVHIARAVAEDFGYRHAHINWASGFWQQRIVVVDGSKVLQPQPVRLFEINEQHADVLISEQVAHRIEHAVAVIAGKSDGLAVEDADEAQIATLI